MMPDAIIEIDPNAKPLRTHRDGIPVPKSKEAKEAVLIQNDVDCYKFVSRERAEGMVAEHKAVILLPSDPDYLEGTRLALGILDGFKKGELIQINGRALHPEEIGKLDVDEIIKSAEAQVSKLKTDLKSGIVVTDQMPPDPQTFQGKARRRGRPRKNPV